MSQDHYSISIGGIELSIHSASAEVKLAPRGAVAAFVIETLSAPPEDHFDLTASVAPIGYSDGERLFSTTSWSLHRENGRLVFDAHSATMPDHPIRRAILDEDSNRIEAIIHPAFARTGESLHPIDYPIDEVLILNLLPERHAIEVHGCGVVTSDGRGLLFAGMSGAGKTTTARMWLENHPRDRILSDDRIIVRRGEGGFRMFGTPWHGEAKLADAASIPLQRLLFLEQDRETRLETVSAAEAVSRLLQCSFVPFYRRELLSRSLEIADEVCRIVGTEVLHFRKDPAALRDL